MHAHIFFIEMNQRNYGQTEEIQANIAMIFCSLETDNHALIAKFKVVIYLNVFVLEVE